jgi:hypothetical protein
MVIAAKAASAAVDEQMEYIRTTPGYASVIDAIRYRTGGGTPAEDLMIKLDVTMRAWVVNHGAHNYTFAEAQEQLARIAADLLK